MNRRLLDKCYLPELSHLAKTSVDVKGPWRSASHKSTFHSLALVSAAAVVYLALGLSPCYYMWDDFFAFLRWLDYVARASRLISYPAVYTTEARWIASTAFRQTFVLTHTNESSIYPQLRNFGSRCGAYGQQEKKATARNYRLRTSFKGYFFGKYYNYLISRDIPSSRFRGREHCEKKRLSSSRKSHNGYRIYFNWYLLV